jgi:hypothetical protein
VSYPKLSCDNVCKISSERFLVLDKGQVWSSARAGFTAFAALTIDFRNFSSRKTRCLLPLCQHLPLGQLSPLNLALISSNTEKLQVVEKSWPNKCVNKHLFGLTSYPGSLFTLFAKFGAHY